MTDSKCGKCRWNFDLTNIAASEYTSFAGNKLCRKCANETITEERRKCPRCVQGAAGDLCTHCRCVREEELKKKKAETEVVQAIPAFLGNFMRCLVGIEVSAKLQSQTMENLATTIAENNKLLAQIVKSQSEPKENRLDSLAN